ncbi:hypothetical protein BKA67DRAFT_652939 [Truncatella angustata]|uniref:NECAP PHear domain-containing protein n=1 Tax=Truncatella angustata TaxID=152316 RepID=A0A9P8UXF2_9PEZI|nr:uncharacterized protein BKA67DRAFT_652939 [Truncatella angustata]KAH6659714.1 hypothetical protein BKA67DRAFT_652939 [Truncatella angustata]KAH8198895.1 hypothetical protein TruAng_006948 [Truncatella angustata]
MEMLDPATGQPLPTDSIQRVLFITNKVHVYNIPPMVPGKGHVAATWTADDNKRQIFTARLRVIETSIPQVDGSEKVKTDIVLEDSSNGQLFAAAPYVTEAVVEQVSDSSRFFALRVQDEAGRKASLGIGFEERTESFDFGVSLQEAKKSLGWDQGTSGGKKPSMERKTSEEKRDYSLKEGETITVNLPGRFQRRRPDPESTSNAPLSSFALAPPPSTSSSKGSGILPPPPSATSTKSQQRLGHASRPSAADLGFDDGKFGEFA